jgi:hypothetical protein
MLRTVPVRVVANRKTTRVSNEGEAGGGIAGVCDSLRGFC